MQYQDLLELFLAAKRAAGLSARTVTWYAGQMSWFFAWLEERPGYGEVWLQPSTIRAALATEAARVEAGDLSPSSLEARYRALSAFFSWLCEWLHTERGVDVDPMRGVKRPKVPKNRPRRTGVEQVRRLLASIPESGDWLDLRDRLAINLLFWLGLRRSEVVGLCLADFDMSTRTVIVKGKGNKDRVVPFPPVVGAALLSYLVSRPALDGPLFLSSTGGGSRVRGVLTADGLHQMLQRRCEHAGLLHLNPHSFRHGIAMALLNDGGADLAMVSRMLGHSSTAITRRFYADYTDDGLRSAYDEALSRLPGGR